MDFGRVLRRIGDHLEARGVRFALVGGHALGAYGLARATLDLDLAVEGEAQEGLIAFMEGEGYETLHRSPGYSNHLHRRPEEGRVDFVYVRGATADRLFSQARRIPGPGGRKVAVPRPEHLIAMKVQAMKEDPERRLQELADIGYLLRLDGVDRQEVAGYFERHGLENELDELG